MPLLDKDIGAATTLVLHHPHFFDASYWRGWSERTKCNIIAVDAPHHGDNDTDQNYRDFAIDTVAAAREVTSTSLIVAGVSQGGVIAQESADQDGVIGVIGISTTRDVAAPEEIESMNQLLEIWCEDGPGDEVAAMIAANSANGIEPSTAATRDVIPRFLKRRLQRSVPLLLNRRGNLGLAVPAQFIHGTADQTYSHEALAAHGVDLVTIEGGSHSVTLQRPDKVAGLIRMFVGSLGAL